MSSLSSLLHKIECYTKSSGHGVFIEENFSSNLIAKRHTIPPARHTHDEQKRSISKVKKFLSSDNHTPLVIGVCFDGGGGIVGNTQWGPLFLRKALQRNYFDLGDIHIIPSLVLDEYLDSKLLRALKKHCYQLESSELKISPLSILSDLIGSIYSAFPDRRCLILGGSHILAYASISELLRLKRQQKRKLAVIHFDAHHDLYPHRQGIPLSARSWCHQLLSHFDDPSLLLQIGVRSPFLKIKGESPKIKRYGVKELHTSGCEEVINKVVSHLQKKRVDELYITLDLDVVDPLYLPLVGTPENDGLFPHELISCLRLLGESFPLVGADVVEFSPFVASKLVNDFLDPEAKGVFLNPEPDSALMVCTTILNEILSQLGGNAR
ncbi:MAG: arginase family protein [Oligoflexia bacterium]|nr:arginase family protein [Oligoflexia bacterium]MBF0366650.1 arginase family protein [Oligoflexia bacterium]